jgi:hypothetical protein
MSDSTEIILLADDPAVRSPPAEDHATDLDLSGIIQDSGSQQRG